MSAIEPSGSVAENSKKGLSTGQSAFIMHTDITTPGRWSRCLWKPLGHHPGGFAFADYLIIFTVLQQSLPLLKPQNYL